MVTQAARFFHVRYNITMSRRAKLLWMDLEMTGLDPLKDKILEVATIATDWDFEEIATYTAIKQVDPVLAKERMSSQFWQENATVRDALLAQNNSADAKSSQIVEDQLLQFVDEHFEAETPILLAGNSIHQDRKFIVQEWPRLDARLHYRMLDVSAWKVVFEGKYRKKFAKPEAHRALEDIRGSIEELKYYLAKTKL